MDSSYARFREVRFFGSLDGLRALSIIGVIWFHSWWSTPFYPTLASLPVLRQGEWGVHIFFVISGFLITTLLLREQKRSGTISIRDFYIRRSLRIWPLYYATVAIYVVIMLTFQRDSARSHTFFHYLPGFLTYTYTWCITPNWPTGPFNLAWTLATEEQFYAFWPLVLQFLRGIWSSAAMVAVIALRLAAGYGWTSRVLPPSSLPARIVLSVAIPICLGVLLGQALDSERGFRWLFLILGGKWAAPAALAALAICLIPVHPPVLAASLATRQARIDSPACSVSLWSWRGHGGCFSQLPIFRNPFSRTQEAFLTCASRRRRTFRFGNRRLSCSLDQTQPAGPRGNVTFANHRGR